MATLGPLTRRSVDLFQASNLARYPVAEAWLYGSRATGTARTDSDVDLASVIEGEPTGPTSSIAAEMGNDTWDVLSSTGLYVSPLPITAAQWRDPAQQSNPYLLASIRREGIAL